MNRSISRAELHYRCQPKGGRLAILADQVEVKQIDTRCDEAKWSIEPVTISGAAQKLALRVQGEKEV